MLPRVVGLQHGAQLCLGALLGGEQPVAVAGQGAKFGQDLAWDRQRPPVGVLMAQGVGQHERVEDVVLAAGGPMALPGAGRDPRRDRIDHMASALQMLDQEPSARSTATGSRAPNTASSWSSWASPATSWARRTWRRLTPAASTTHS